MYHEFRFLAGDNNCGEAENPVRALLVLLITLVTLSLGACSQEKSKDARELTALVSIEGSDTMTSLVRSWATNFMQHEPNVPISVNSGDSGGGIDALINRTTDLAAASRDLSPSENRRLHDKSIKLKKVTVARDSVAIIVNSANPVQSLTLEQLKGIFAGSIKTWNQVGGTKLPINVFSREENSGTYKFFKEHLLQNVNYSRSAKTVLSGADLLMAISRDKGAIGYIGMGSASSAGNKVKVLGLKLSLKSESVKPTELSTVTDYPLSRPLIMFMDEDPKPSVQKFVDYCLSADAQKLVREQGYAPVEKNLH
jgi:phosphate transport system substrate-binding protein